MMECHRVALITNCGKEEIPDTVRKTVVLNGLKEKAEIRKNLVVTIREMVALFEDMQWRS